MISTHKKALHTLLVVLVFVGVRVSGANISLRKSELALVSIFLVRL